MGMRALTSSCTFDKEILEESPAVQLFQPKVKCPFGPNEEFELTGLNVSQGNYVVRSSASKVHKEIGLKE